MSTFRYWIHLELIILLLFDFYNLILQDADGNTPLHVAVQGSCEMIGMLISSGRIDWELRNKERLNVFLSAISTDALKYDGLYKYAIQNKFIKFFL